MGYKQLGQKPPGIHEEYVLYSIHLVYQTMNNENNLLSNCFRMGKVHYALFTVLFLIDVAC